MAFLRYQTVRNVGLGVLGLGGVVAIVVATSGGDKPVAPAPVVSHTPEPARPAAPSMPATPATPTRPSVALDDATIAARADQAASPGEKIKDAFKTNATKVNLYEETQDTVYDRLKIDSNRDDVWDQQWTRVDGHWKRDDGKLLVAGQWADTAPTAPTPEAPATPVPAAEPYAAQLAQVAKVMLEERATSDKIKDYFRGNGPKVNIYDDNKDGRWDRAKVDYDRDEVDDDKLTVKAGFLERKVEKTGVVSVWDSGAWRTK